MRLLQRPAYQIVDTIEFNREHLEDVSVAELDVLKATADALIIHIEKLKSADRTDHQPATDAGPKSRSSSKLEVIFNFTNIS